LGEHAGRVDKARPAAACSVEWAARAVVVIYVVPRSA